MSASFCMLQFDYEFIYGIVVSSLLDQLVAEVDQTMKHQPVF